MDTIPADAAAAPAPAAAVLQPQASHGQGARGPSCAPCHACHQRRPLTWIFAQGFCEGCRAEPACRQNFLSLRQASRRFGLDGSDLAHTDRQPVQNPVHRNFPPMQLFRKADVEAVAKRKHGSEWAEHACVLQAPGGE